MERLARRLRQVRVALMMLDGFVGASALVTGLAVLTGIIRLPGDWTDSMSYLFTGDIVPCWLLVVVVGGSALVTVGSLLRTPGFGSAYTATYSALIIATWMVVESVSLGPATWLEPFYGTLTVLIAALSFAYLWLQADAAYEVEHVPAPRDAEIDSPMVQVVNVERNCA